MIGISTNADGSPNIFFQDICKRCGFAVNQDTGTLFIDVFSGLIQLQAVCKNHAICLEQQSGQSLKR